MHIEAFREYCLKKPGTTEELPFGPDTLVFKVMGKIYALTDINNFESINLKCHPEKAVQLREKYPGIRPGYHMNKRHWNTVETNGSIPDAQLEYLINHSYELVASKLPSKVKKQLQALI